MPIENDDIIKEILKKSSTIAVIGVSNKPDRDSYRVWRYLKQAGYDAIPVNPNYKEIEGEKCYPNLSSIDKAIDIVDVFRNPEKVDDVVDEAISVKAKVIWFQLGVINPSAAMRAEKAGLQVIMDHCIAIDHTRLIPKD